MFCKQFSVYFYCNDDFSFVQEEDWWTGKIGDRMGVFPFNYVEVTSEASASSPAVQEVFKLAKLDKVFVLYEWCIDVFMFSLLFILFLYNLAAYKIPKIRIAIHLN